MKEAFSVLAGILFIAAFIPYVRAILRKETRPAKASWLIWATLDTVTLVDMHAKHAVNGQIIAAVLGASTIVFLSLRFGESGWTKLDKLYLGGAAVGIGLYFYSPLLSIAASLFTVFIGSFPTFTRAWKNPENEDRLAWSLWWLSCVAALIAVPQWTIADAAQPLTFTVIESVMVFILFIKPTPNSQSKKEKP